AATCMAGPWAGPIIAPLGPAVTPEAQSVDSCFVDLILFVSRPKLGYVFFITGDDAAAGTPGRGHRAWPIAVIF
ncbi:MAG: hypothetical protein WAV38_16470, partial [Xanthobacteraceae bacterium]